jgi:uncharacterized repeat protein (TIGR01451 family)
MARRWSTHLSSLLLVATFIGAAVAQDTTDQPAPRSIFGSLFGQRTKTTTSPSNNRSNQSGSKLRQMSDAADDSTPTDQMPPDPATSQSYTLPGLGGSPLPGAKSNTTNGTPQNRNASTTTQKPGSTTAGQRYNSTSSAARRNSVRQLNVSAPSNDPNSTQNNYSTSSATRQSPSRRTAPHMNSSELRNDLSGSFSSPSNSSEPTARTARADEHPITPVVPPTLETSAKAGLDTNAALEPSHSLNTSKEQPKQEVDAVEREPRNAAEAFGTAKETRPGNNSSSIMRTPALNSPAAGPQTARGKEAFGEALQVASGGDPNVLASNQTPVLTADIRGPKQILIGRESVYRVRLQNQSDIAAEGIVATVRVPAGADVANATATQGNVQQSSDSQNKGQLQWQIARLDRHANETLELRVVPRESRPMELGITWTIAPVGSRAVVEVQEPKLQLEITGPSEVYFDKPQVFKLSISNPGTGPAENVKIDLMPPGAKDGAAKPAVTSHPLGDLPPGGSQSVEVELTAREAGKMFVKAKAVAEGGLSCQATKEVFCRKPELEVDWRGPATKYAGTLATYFLRVRNPGTAPAEDVTVRAVLPEGAEFTSASEGQAFDSKLREVAWHVGTLRPGDDNYMELKCVLKSPGTNQLKITAATAAGSLSDTKTAATNVVALADLKLEVADPSGPVAVGSPAVYEIHIKNRGANSAKDVNVVGLFSEGIEPEHAEGAIYTVADGRVSFRTIEELQAGREVVLRIRAHAVQPGTHIFRAEVLCRDLEIKLAAEETTRFYTDDVAPDAGKSQKHAADRSEAFHSSVR